MNRKKRSAVISLGALLKQVLSQPTAPFRESWVQRTCLDYCEQAGLPVFEDAVGNLWVNAKTSHEAKNASLIFVAHLDHPGMVITGFQKKGTKLLATADWLGGGPMDIRNMAVKVFSHANAFIVLDGKVLRHTRGPRGAKDVVLEITPTAEALAVCNSDGLRMLGPWGACLWYTEQGLPQGIARSEQTWVTKAADDLAGACALMHSLAAAGKPRGVVVLLTRAEESGFHGTLAVLRKKILDPRKTLMVSIETSAVRPGAELGKGPVVRLGDKATIFDPLLVAWVQSRAEELAKSEPSFRFQRQVMDGGTCEATAFNYLGFRVAGISVPLKNYHNQSETNRPRPEEIGLKDVDNLALLLTALMSAHRRAHARDLARVVFEPKAKSLFRHHDEQKKYFNGF